MELIELEPRFLKIKNTHSFIDVDFLSGADGLIFLCPACFKKNNGRVGTHSIICWFSWVDQTMDPKPGRWKPVGSNFSDLSLTAGSSSILLRWGDCKAHFWIKNGKIIFCE